MFVTGCHRSGTSLLASLMHGLVVGQDPRLRRGDLELKLENPLGFFESERIVKINDALLQALGCQWDRPPLLPSSWDKPPLLDLLQIQRSKLESYALGNIWVDKDPRLCLTYPAYFHILLRRIPLVVALREPLAVATSLHARNGFSLNRGLFLWWIYNYHIAAQLCPEDFLVPYSNLLILDDQSLQNLVGPFLEFHNHQRPSTAQACNLLTTLLKPEFNRSEGAFNFQNRSYIHPQLLRVCETAYNDVVQSNDILTSFKDIFSVLPRVVLECAVYEQLSPECNLPALQNRFNLIESELRDVGTCLEERDRDIVLLRQHLSSIERSSSWKITAPLRYLVNLFRLLIR